MVLPPAPQAFDTHHIAAVLGDVLLSPGSTFSLMSLAVAGAVAAGFLVRRRLRAGRGMPRMAAMGRALFRRGLWLAPSSRADGWLFLLNTFATGALIGWGIWSASAIANSLGHALDGAFGPTGASVLPSRAASGLVTLALFLAYDFSYWVDHWLKHKVPLLWEFHRVHHTAEVLTPLTAFRMHPVDSLVFTNIVALGVGAAAGVMHHLMGPAQPVLLSGTNVLLVLFVCTTIHLQHSHLPIHFKGWLGRIIFSPAHHQVHHSTCPAHFGSNLGSCLAVWDRMFGTLIDPISEQAREKLTFGADVEQDRYGPHTIAGLLIQPFVNAGRLLIPQQAQALLPFGAKRLEGEVPAAARKGRTQTVHP